MADDVKCPDIVCEGADAWAPFVPSGSDLLSKNGLVRCKVATAVPGQNSKKDGFVIRTNTVVDDPSWPEEDQGKSIQKSTPYAGPKRNDGKPAVTGLYDMLHSAGKSKEEIAKMAGKTIEVAKTCKWLEGKYMYFRVSAVKSDKGRPYSEADFTDEQTHKDAVSSTTHLQSYDVNALQTNRRGPKSNGATSNGVAAPAASGEAVADLM